MRLAQTQPVKGPGQEKDRASAPPKALEEVALGLETDSFYVLRFVEEGTRSFSGNLLQTMIAQMGGASPLPEKGRYVDLHV